MTNEKEEARKMRFIGILDGGNIVIEYNGRVQELYQSGFGEIVGQKLILSKCEGLYLYEINKIEIFYNNRSISFSELMETFYRKDKNILSRYLVYRDLRNRGFVVKESLEDGIDFYIYNKDDYKVKAAKYTIFVLNEGYEIEFEKIFENIKKIKKEGNGMIIAVLDRRGEVIYYQVSEATFYERK
ncbi:MAG: tRNA-intron lyase [Nitrososphaeria archaeon]